MFSKDRYKAFLRSLRMWRHIRMTKRGGRSYDPTGIEGTSPGELAVLCPACPIPFINLPPNWHSVGKDLEYVNPLCACSSLLMVFISGIYTTKRLASTPASGSRGGKFQAMRRIRSWVLDTHTSLHGIRIVTISVALPIRKRFVTFVTQYLALFYVRVKQMSTCSGLSALDHANSKYTKGYATSGIVCTTCRHEFILPEGAGQLQKGERFVSTFMLFVYTTEFYQKICQHRLRSRPKHLPQS